jgi:uncharacterized protein (TIGR03067 family)
MKCLCFLAVFCSTCLLFSWASTRADDKDDAPKTTGTWIPTSAELGGNKFPDEVLKSIKLVIDGDKYTVTVGEVTDKGTAKVDSKAKPMSIDILGTDGPNKGKTILGIFELTGDTLKVCYDLSGKARPTAFESKPNTQLFLVTYKREKP